MKKQFDFIGKRMILFVISLVVIAAGVVSFIVQGFNVGQDFTGGTQMSFVLHPSDAHDQTVDITADVEKTLEDIFTAAGASSVRVTANSEAGSVTVNTSVMDSEAQKKAKDAVAQKYYFAEDEYQFKNISGNVSRDLRDKAIKGVSIAVVLMLLYITVRFDWRSGIAAVLCLIHDVLIMFTAYTIFQIPLDSSMIAAVLTILGYSINATIIVFDRTRENNKLDKKSTFAENANRGVNQTLTRSLNTTLTTLFTIGMIFILGPSSIKTFALPIIVGVIAGLYSSVCLATNFWVLFKGKKANEK